MATSENTYTKASEPSSGETTESVVSQRPRRYFSASAKLRIVNEANACANRGDIGALLRREGVYSTQLAKWRRLFNEGGVQAIHAPRRGPKPKSDAKDKRIAELEKKLGRVEGKLSVAHKLLELQKKVSALFGIELPTDEANS